MDLSKITVEPTIWFYMMAMTTTSVIEQEIIIWKSSILYSNATTIEIQKYVSNFQFKNNICSHILPVFFSLFLGNWSDKYGRKLALLIGLISKLLYSIMIVINILNTKWNLDMIIYTATIPSAILFGDIAIFSSCLSYISDITTFKNRSMRIIIFNMVWLSTQPIGFIFGVFMYKLHNSYIIMYLYNIIFLIISILYTFIFIKFDFPKLTDFKIMFYDFFDIKNAINTLLILAKVKKNKLKLWILTISMCLYVFQRDEKWFMYLYTKHKFSWTYEDYGYFKFCQSTLFFINSMILVYIKNNVKTDETIFALIGILSKICGYIIFVLADISILFYFGSLAGSLSPLTQVMIRSMIAKNISKKKSGKMFTLLSICDNLIPFLSLSIYSLVYNNTITTYPNFIYYITIILEFIIGILMFVIKFFI